MLKIPRHRIIGRGPALLLIHGSGGDMDSFSRIEAELAASFRVITYERRNGSGACIPTLDEHVEDALHVLDACGISAAYMLGSSAGAVIGLCVLSAFPERVCCLVAHEPPLLAVLDDCTDLRERFDRVLRIEVKVGTEAACNAFFRVTGILGDADNPLAASVSRAVAARPVPPIREIHPILDYEPDLGALRAQKEKIKLAVGTAHPNSMPVQATRALAEALALTPLVLTGNHFGYMDFASENSPDDFAGEVVKAIGP
jgi:pimeloyl-ACP methyl ester carboxylesterase